MVRGGRLGGQAAGAGRRGECRVVRGGRLGVGGRCGSEGRVPGARDCGVRGVDLWGAGAVLGLLGGGGDGTNGRGSGEWMWAG